MLRWVVPDHIAPSAADTERIARDEQRAVRAFWNHVSWRGRTDPNYAQSMVGLLVDRLLATWDAVDDFIWETRRRA